MSVQHTPGPWHVNSSIPHEVVAEDGDLGVASTFGLSLMSGGSTLEAEWDANARLIAAAPDLLEALERILPEIEDEIEQRSTSGNNEYWRQLAVLRDLARHAVARARGE